MKKLIVDILLVVIPVTTVLVTVNFLGDPAHKFDKDYERHIVELMQAGNGVTNVDNCNERKLKKSLIEANRNRHFDYLVFGSSRCMTISRKLTGADLFNLAVSGATVQDYLAMLELCKENNISYDHIIISIDPELFNSNNTDKRWTTNREYFEKITNTTLNYSKKQDALINTMLSGSYFQASLEYIMKYGIGERLAVAKKDENLYQTNFPDGSMTYGEVYRNTPQKKINSFAGHALRPEYSSYVAMSSDYQHLFDLFLEKATDKHQSVTFVTFPYLKGYYDKLIAVSGVKQQELYIKNLASQNHYPDYGSLNPDDAGVSNNDFYDELHLRRNAIGKLCKDYNIFN